MPWEKELAVARSAALRAGQLALEYQRKGVRPEAKPDLSPVTIADKESEKLIAAEISAAFPDDGILGEEGCDRGSKNGRRWIVDPIDGTRDFVRGLPLWSVLIGFEEDGEVVAGIAYFPGRDEWFHATKGDGAFRNGERIRVSEIDRESDAMVCVTGLKDIQAQPWAEKLVPWFSRFWAVRSYGGCVDAVMVASGRADAWIEPVAAPWDLAPLKILLEEAGARFFSFDGRSTIYGGNCIACVPALEGAARELIRLASDEI
jgi:histidinol-phosphatase